MDFSEFQNILFSATSQHFGERGYRETFRDVSLEMTRLIGADKAFLFLRTGENRGGNTFYASVGFYVSFSIIDDFILKYRDRLHPNIPRHTIGVETKSLNSNYQIEVRSREEIVNIVPMIINQYENILVPFLEDFMNIIVLNEFVNTPFDKFQAGIPISTARFHWYRKMIIAKLAGNPEYEKIEQYVLDLHRTVSTNNPESVDYKNAMMIVEGLVDDLAQISPVRNPILLDLALVK
ncbi:hypothetical protein [Pseudochryseolinea flava]|uniref:Uncharacterized protein n=1 Tax=Pseudochryseolinea flava TaxID=2059302 RepID=A0A364XW57_9BACT|nr:hypothetical protein [Pseudochryseolinea flava]RAV97623.1 hypothetical protein DQQ10_27460 [Pseudochryseolinea flava]